MIVKIMYIKSDTGYGRGIMQGNDTSSKLGTEATMGIKLGKCCEDLHCKVPIPVKLNTMPCTLGSHDHIKSGCHN